MRDLRGSEQPIDGKNIALEKEIFSIKHSDFWRTLDAEMDRIIKNSQEAILTKQDFTLMEIAHLQGIYSIVKKIKNFPESYLSKQEK